MEIISASSNARVHVRLSLSSSSIAKILRASKSDVRTYEYELDSTIAPFTPVLAIISANKLAGVCTLSLGITSGGGQGRGKTRARLRQV
jgi:hypothetical protein